jgi:hypothetical protein
VLSIRSAAEPSRFETLSTIVFHLPAGNPSMISSGRVLSLSRADPPHSDHLNGNSNGSTGSANDIMVVNGSGTATIRSHAAITTEEISSGTRDMTAAKAAVAS